MEEDKTTSRNPAFATNDAGPRRRVCWGRFLSLTGFVLLCVSFFLPQVPGCNEPIVPADETVGSNGAFLIALGIPFLAAALLLPFYACHALSWLVRSPRARKTIALIVCVLALLALVPGTLRMAEPIPSWMASPIRELSAWVWIGCTGFCALVTVLAFAGLASRSADRKAAAAVFGVGAASLVYFGFWVWCGEALYGLWVSVSASGLIALGAAIDWFQSRPARNATPPRGPATSPRTAHSPASRGSGPQPGGPSSGPTCRS